MSAPPGDRSAALRLEDLRKVYGGRLGRQVEALKSLTLTVARGEIFGLLGPNGAGKTTTVKLLLGLIKPTRGSAEVLGEPAGSVAALRRLGYLAESSRLPYHMTGRRALCYFAALSGVPAAQRGKRADEWLEKVGLSRAADEKIATYSKGMGQRIGLAQALIHDPELIILDEPTDGLDPVGRREVRELLFDIKKTGKTVFINSHLLQEVELCCDRVAIVDRGEVVKQGTLEQLREATAEYEITTTGTIETAEAKLREQCEVFERLGGGRLRVHLKSEDAVDGVVDTLREAKVGIRAIVPVRRTLEDIFVDALGKGGGKEVGA